MCTGCTGTGKAIKGRTCLRNFIATGGTESTLEHPRRWRVTSFTGSCSYHGRVRFVQDNFLGQHYQRIILRSRSRQQEAVPWRPITLGDMSPPSQSGTVCKTRLFPGSLVLQQSGQVGNYHRSPHLMGLQPARRQLA